MRRSCLTELVSVVKLRFNGINMQAVSIRWSGAYSKRLDESSLNYADVASLVSTGAIGNGHAWSVLSLTCLMLLM